MSKKAKPTAKTAPEASGAAPLSAGTKRLFWAITLLIPVFFFVLLELGLRVFGYGEDYPMFEAVEGHPDVLVQSREVGRRYFAQTDNVPNANADYFLASKPDDAFRIVTQGGSSAAGFPYYWGAAFPRITGNLLRASYPGERIEVINTAMAAVNSYTLLDLAPEIVRQRPDAVLIYAGHNEYYGALGAASAERLASSPALVRAYLSLRRFRTIQLLRNVIAGVRGAGVEAPGAASGEGNPNDGGTLMSRMVGEQSVPLDSETYQTGLRQYRENLDRLLATYESAGIPVFIGTLVANERDQRPFATVHAVGTDTTAYGAAIREGLALFARGDSAAAVPVFRRALEVSTEAAEAHYRLGQALLASGDAERAHEAFLHAKDLDAIRFRAPEAFNDVIREVAHARGATVVETLDAVRAASPDGIVGDEMMLEHLHPTLAGYDAIAGAFHEAIVASDLIAPEAQAAPSPRAVRLATDVDSLVGAIRVARLTQSWPFRPDERRPLAVDTSRTAPEVYRFAEDLADDEVGWETATDAYATFEAGRGNWSDALRARQAMLMMYWFEGATHATLASMRMQMARETGRPELVEQARANYLAAIARDPDNGPSLSMLGAIYVQRSEEAKASGALEQATAEREEAIGYLERARRAMPGDAQVLYNLAGAYALGNRWRDALRTVDLLLAQNPQHAAGLALKQSVLANMG